MADIYSPFPASSQLFTSKSRPPFGASMGVLSAHNQLPQPATPNPLNLPQPAKVTQKRRHSDDSDDDMEQANSQANSPSPEKRVMAAARSRKLPMKKVRVEADSGTQDKQDQQKSGESEIDVANARVLLANLPLTSYPQLVQSLIEKDPSITKLLISVIPRPSAEAAREAIVQATKKLRDAIPYSANAASSATHPPSRHLSSGGRASPSTAGVSTGSSALGITTGTTANGGFGSSSHTHVHNASGLEFSFGSSSSISSSGGAPGQSSHQRDAYVLNRLRPAIQSFISTVHAYLPYFTYIPEPVSLSSLQNANAPLPVKAQTQDQPHLDETFAVLASLTNSLLSLPSNAFNAMNQQSNLPERLIKEWEAWLAHLDEAVNAKGEMFSGEQARSWIHALDSFANGQVVSTSTVPGLAGGGGLGYGYGGFSTFSTSSLGFGAPSANAGLSGWGTGLGSGSWGGHTASGSTSAATGSPSPSNVPEMKNIRDKWVERVGWLVGRRPPAFGFEAMDEL